MQKRKLMLMSPMLHQGGFERVCITTARLLEPYFDITIVIFDSANIAYNVDGLNIIDIHMGVKKNKIGKLLNIVRRTVKVKKLKKQIKPEIVYSFGPTANMVNAFSKTGREKVWLGLRNYTDVEENLKMKLFTQFADLIVCCSKEIEKEVKNKFRFNKTAILYNLYDVKSIRSEAEEKEVKLPFEERDESGKKLRILVSMGRDDDMKGFWHMIKAFSLIHERIPESRLLLLGAGSFAHYRKLAKELGVGDAVCFAGMQKEPYSYLKKGEVYLLTSQNEGFPNALVEGMVLGLAAVSVNCLTGPAEILTEGEDAGKLAEKFIELEKNKETPVMYGEYGIILPEMQRERNLNPDYISAEERRMADIVVKLLEDKEMLENYQKAAARRAQCFTYEKYREEFLELCKSL